MMMQRRSHDDDGYEPDSAICLTDRITSRKLTSYDDLYDSTILPKPAIRTGDLATATKRKSPEPGSDGEQVASAKRPKLDAQHQDGQAALPKGLSPEGLQEGVSSAQAEDLWQRRGGRLPVEIWQHVFTYLYPRQLGNLLVINRLFHALLHSSPLFSVQTSVPGSPSTPSILPFLKPDTIWQISRRMFSPGMPAPLKGKTELDMWRIVCARSCQFCGNVEVTTADGHAIGEVDPWHRGPGAKGVSPVFPFGIAICGPCLVQKSVKELDLILSSVPSALHPALPAAFLTSDLHIISPATLQRNSDFSTREKPSRIYWPEHIEQVKTEFESVRSLGSAAAEEWLKGLDARGKKALVDASRWEKWELAGGRARVRELFLPTPASKIGSTSLETTTSLSVTPKTDPAIETEAATSVLNTVMAPTPAANIIPGLNAGLPPKQQPESHSSAPSTVTNTKAQSDFQKAHRRAEIERRAAALSPPIPPNVLAHMFSFKAAVQIPSPLDEQAWDVLKPRLLAQREAAVQKVREDDAAALAVQPPASAVLGEVPDELWDEAQGPLRARLVSYADEIIAKQWDDGDKVSKKTSARFAVEVLLHVRKRFYADVEKDAADARAAGREPIIDPPQGPWTQKLTIENMKWIFDLKIRPLTEKHKKEPFFCNGCTQQKTFGLEGVIQHYAAKHNSALSRGSIVVFWRAEWPAVAPFSPDPTRPGVAAQPKSSTKSQGQQKQGVQSKADQLRPRVTEPLHVHAAAPMEPTSSNPFSMAYQTSAHREPAIGLERVVLHGTDPTVATPTLQPPVQSRLPGSTPQPARAKFMENMAKKTWKTIMSTSGAASIKAAILIHHVAKSFQKEYGEVVPLEMFAAWVRRCPEPSPAAMLKKIQCKLCAAKQGFKLDDLLHHFKATHLDKKKDKADWRTDMVSLPHINELKKLPQMLKGSPVAFQLAVDAMPWAFDAPQGPASSQQQAQYRLPTRPTSAVAPGIGYSDIPSAGWSLGQVQPLRPEAPRGPQQGFHITTAKAVPASAGTAPPQAPTGPAAMTSKSGHAAPREQAQAVPVPPQKDPASIVQPATISVDEDMEDAYSPPPPEAYQTQGPVQAVSDTVSSNQVPAPDSGSSGTAEQTKKNGSASANAPKRPSTYYHQENKPILRPASAVYSRTKPQPNRNAAGASHGEPAKAPMGPRVERQPATQPKRDGRHNHPQPRLQGQAGLSGPMAPNAQNGRNSHQPAPPQYHADLDTADAGPRRGRQPTQPTATHRRRSISPASRGLQAMPHYRERSPPRHYYDHPPPPGGGYMPAESAEYRRGVEYEVVRVRDPAGDYLLRRPIRSEAYKYDPRGAPPPPPAAMEYHQPQYIDVYGQLPYASYPAQRASTVAPYPVHHAQQASSMAPPPQGYGPPVVYEEYSPHDPARLPPPRPHRYGTEARY